MCQNFQKFVKNAPEYGSSLCKFFYNLPVNYTRPTLYFTCKHESCGYGPSLIFLKLHFAIFFTEYPKFNLIVFVMNNKKKYNTYVRSFCNSQFYDIRPFFYRIPV